MTTARAILDRHLRRYPRLQPVDIYKLVHQSVFGPGHIIRSAESARDKLEEELARIQPTGNDDEVESIDPAGRLIRADLRPLLGHDDAVDRLTMALMRSAHAVHGSVDEMVQRLAGALDWCHRRAPFYCEGLAELAAEAGAAGFPAYHHSVVYVECYRPAYRVVLAELWPARASG